MEWLSQSYEHETAKWEVTGLDAGLWIREDDCITGFIITMAWLKLNDWTTVTAIFRSHGYEPLPVTHSKNYWSVKELWW